MLHRIYLYSKQTEDGDQVWNTKYEFVLIELAWLHFNPNGQGFRHMKVRRLSRSPGTNPIWDYWNPANPIRTKMRCTNKIYGCFSAKIRTSMYCYIPTELGAAFLMERCKSTCIWCTYMKSNGAGRGNRNLTFCIQSRHATTDTIPA